MLKRKCSLLLAATSIAALSVGVCVFGNSGVMRPFFAQDRSASVDYMLTLDDKNAPTESTSYTNVQANAISGNEYSKISYTNVKALANGHCSLDDGGTIEKVGEAKSLLRIFIKKSSAGALEIQTMFVADGEVTTYKIAEGETEADIDICGNYLKVVAEGQTDILTMSLIYKCSGDEAVGHTFGELITEKAATTEAAGHKAHYECELCGATFDTNKEHQIDVVLPKIVEKKTISLKNATLKGKTADSTTGGINSYSIEVGEMITVVADNAPTGQMFVGFDRDVVNNRVGQPGEKEYQLEMPSKDVEINAIYSNEEKNVLLTNATGSAISFATNEVFTAAEDIKGSDAELENAYGYKLTLDPTATAMSSKPGNFKNAHMETINDNSSGTNKPNPQYFTNKVILKNESAHDLVVELYTGYFGNDVTSGLITVPAGEKVVKCFITNPLIKSSADAGIALRNNVGGTAGETVILKVAMTRASTYPNNGYFKPEGFETVNLENAVTTTVDGYAAASGKRSGVSGSSYMHRWYGETGAMWFASQSNTVSQPILTNSSNFIAASFNNLPSYSADKPKLTLYFRFINLLTYDNNNTVSFKTVINNGNNVNLQTKYCNPVDVSFSQPGEVKVIKMEIDRSKDTTRNNYHVNLVNFAFSSSSNVKHLNFLMQISLTDSFGYEK